MRFLPLSLLALLSVAGFAARASGQTVPTATQPLTARTLLAGAGSSSIDLRAHFGLPDVSGQVVQVDTILGRFNLELFDDTPLTRANFLAYVNSGRYDGTIVHRSVSDFVIQAGGYFSRLPFEHIATFGPVQNEFRRSNLRGTVAMAKLGGDPNSATSEWFVNLANNSANLDTQNGGFTVFARVIGSGMNVVDAIAALPRYNISGSLGDIPLRDVGATQQSVEVRNLITVNNVVAVPIYPPAARSVLTFLAQSSSPAVTATVSGSTLILTPVSAGNATITVRAVDTNNNVVDRSFDVTVTPGIAITTAPSAQHVTPGSTVALTVAAQASGTLSYQWRKDGNVIPGATNATLTLASASAADMAFYAVTITSGTGTVTSDAVAVTVENPSTSRLVNVSTRGSVQGGETLTPGFVIRGTGTKNLVIRAVGPSLGQFGVTDALTDPRMEIIPQGQTTPLLTNDDWHSASAADVAALTARSQAVGAFALLPASKDAATLAGLAVNASGAYTVAISPAGASAGGIALAEVYDADAATSPVRLINVSTLGTVTADGLTPGFVIGGSASKRVLIRAVGPTLSTFSVEGALVDPQLTVYPLGKTFSVASNNDWSAASDAAALNAAFKSAGAFTLPNGSRDAAVVVRLPPGAYTAVATGVGGTSGRALVEVYDLDP